MKQLEQAFHLVNDKLNSQKDSCGPISTQTIISAEQALKVQFPHTYKVFLQEYGCGGLRKLDIYGLVKDENFNAQILPFGGSPNVVWTTLIDHRDFGHPLHLPIIYNVGEGTKYCLNTTQMSRDKECPVIAWPIGGVDPAERLEVIAPDFGTWFLEMVEEEIAGIEEDNV